MARRRWQGRRTVRERADAGDGELARYLVRPRRSEVEEIDGRVRSVARHGRAERVAEVRSLRRRDRRSLDLDAMVRDYRGTLVRGGAETPLTGIQLIEMAPDDAERLGRDQPALVVLRDRSIDLIRPVRRSPGASKVRPAAADLWHLGRIGLGGRTRARLSATGAGVTVAVLDTGIDGSHPELEGAVDAVVRFDPASGAVIRAESCIDTDGHGTHVAGLICGRRVGVAPGAKAVGAVMLPGGRGMLSDFVLALEWAGQEESVQVVNLSAGIPGRVDGMQETIGDLRRVGVLPVVAIGNEGAGKTRSPGNYAEVLSVGAAARDGGVAAYSGSGRIADGVRRWSVPALVAPGEQVMSAVIGGGYEAWDGTSMATPIVAGLAALLIEAHGGGDLTVADLETLLLESCTRLDGPVGRQGRGLARVHRTLRTSTPARHAPVAKPPPAQRRARKARGSGRQKPRGSR